MALCVPPEDTAAAVCLVVSGRPVPENVVTKSCTQRVGIVRWVTAYELVPGDTINFRTMRIDDGDVACATLGT